MWSCDGVEVNGFNVLKKALLVQNTEATHVSNSTEDQGTIEGVNIPNAISCYQSTETVSGNRETGNMVAFAFQLLNGFHDLERDALSASCRWAKEQELVLTSLAIRSPPQSTPSYVESSLNVSATSRCSFGPSGPASVCVSRAMRASSARWPGLPHIPCIRTRR